MNIGTSLKTISKNQLCSFIGTGGYVELAENDVLSDGSIVTAVAVLPLLNSRNDKGEGILPPGYQKVEFLASSGTQYIELPDRFNFGQDPETNSGILLKTSDYATKAGNYAFYVPVSTSAGHMPKSDFFMGRRVANESLLRVGLSGLYTISESYIDGKVYEASINFLNSGVMEVGEKSQNIVYNPAAYGEYFRILRRGTVCRLYEARTSTGEELTHSLIPALDPAGEPCTFDTVTKQPFYNAGTGSFRVGIATLQQVRELQLPDNTGNAVRTLYVSLPQEARTDFAAQKHLSDLTDLNWSINAQYRDGDIPADYTKVDFLESTGTQYIELPDSFITTADFSFSLECQQTKATQGYWQHAFGERSGNYDTGAALSDTVTCVVSWRAARSMTVAEFERFSVFCDVSKIVVNGVVSEWNNSANVGREIPYLRVFDKFGGHRFIGRIFNVNVRNAGAALYDLIPVINENGVPGMWDKVGKQFFENSGTGAFVVGIKTLNDARMLNNALPDVTAESPASITLSLPVEASTDAPTQKALKELSDRGWNIIVQYREDKIPAGYAKVAFLESSGTQYIDTGIVTDGTYTITATLRGINAAGFNAIWGRMHSNGESYAVRFKASYYLIAFYYGWAGQISEPQLDSAQAHDYIVTEGQKNIIVDGKSFKLNALNTKTLNASNPNSQTYYLFAANNVSKAPVCFYSFRMQDGSGNTVLDFIPVINTDGVPGMWDTVSQQFFENAGTGQFRVGLASKEAVRNLYLTPDVPAGTTINLSVPAGTTTEDTDTLKANNPNYTFNIRYRS